jgi:hypothetical protein
MPLYVDAATTTPDNAWTTARLLQGVSRNGLVSIRELPETFTLPDGSGTSTGYLVSWEGGIPGRNIGAQVLNASIGPGFTTVVVPTGSINPRTSQANYGAATN